MPARKSPEAPTKRLNVQQYLQKILTAQVYDVAIETELTLAKNLSQRTGNHIYLKREDSQPVFSFKLRGAYNKMVQLPAQQLKRGVICASAGNHAQGVALAAQKLHCHAVIVMPTTTPQLKIDAVLAFNAEVVLFGESYSDAHAHARVLEKKHGLCFVHPFDDPDVIAGQGTIAMEILRQHQGPIDAVFVAIGGGGLISGVAAYIKAVRPDIKVIGVQMQDSDAMLRSVKAGKRVVLKEVGLFSDGTAVKQVGAETFRLCKALVDDYVLVGTDAVCAAMKDVFQDTRSILEPAGALAVAGLKSYIDAHRCKGRNFVAITCGANMNFDRLRFIAERADVGEEREALFAVTIPEQRGAFKKFCQLVGPRNVTEFNYRISGASQAHIFVGLGTKAKGESAKVAQLFEKHGYATLDITGDEMAKEHIRHLVGGRAPLAEHELLYRFEFPERPGALMNFLSAMNPTWNISLFHYRNQGADYGRILVGLQVPQNERQAFKQFLVGLGYPFVDESQSALYQLFLK